MEIQNKITIFLPSPASHIKQCNNNNVHFGQSRTWVARTTLTTITRKYDNSKIVVQVYN